MDAMIDVNEREAQRVAIRRQRRRVPFEIINTFLTVICLASAGVVVYKLLKKENTDAKGSLPNAIHAKSTNISEHIIYMAGDEWVYNGVIHPPCDGLYLIYAQVRAQQNSDITVEKAAQESVHHVWPIGKPTMNQTLVTFCQLRKGEIIYMKVNQDGIDIIEAFLRITLLEAQPDMESCKENMNIKP